ncbi:OsmC family protein [Polaribacter sp. HL-MS24]|uniref:OsmC family protein n=1 Tax=Polaribacter sp. HL-MS24 TaxID=3077735 RepID=UPI002934B3E1|nr:OsmC family protein [Polaribacter sp. HL-MS24]WOC39278.1 OsmC family protein [Polaribacter sp. HL-MS24]
MSTNTITTTWKEKMLFESDNPSGHSLLIDNPEEEGGLDISYRPKALMLSSLAGCSGLDVVSLLKKMRVNVDDFKIVVTGELTEEHPKFYHKVLVDYHFYGNELHEEKINKAVDLSVEKYCGVMEMFRQFATLTIAIHLHE